jgi:hypothetical protein
LVVVLSVLLWFTASDYPFGISTLFSRYLHRQKPRMNSGAPEGQVFSFTCGTHRVTLVTNTMIKHNEERTGLWLRQTYPWSFVTDIP